MFAFYLLPFFGCLEHMNFGQGIRHADARLVWRGRGSTRRGCRKGPVAFDCNWDVLGTYNSIVRCTKQYEAFAKFSDHHLVSLWYMIKIGFLNYSWTWASGPAECPIADMIPNSHVGFMHFFPGHFVSKCPALEISNLSRDLLPIVQWFFRPTIPTLLNTGHISLSLHKTWVSRLWSAWIATIKNGYTLENTEKNNPSH